MNKNGIITEITTGVLVMIIGTFIISLLGWNNVVIQVQPLTEQNPIAEMHVSSSSAINFSNAEKLLDLSQIGAFDVFYDAVLYLLKVLMDSWIYLVLVAVGLALRAPFIAFRLIRRNRQLGRDIYRELAQADRFMDIWNAEIPLLSDSSQHHWAFVPNGNKQAANLNRIDGQLLKLKLIELTEQRDSAGNVRKYARRRSGLFLIRNSLVYAFLLFFRVTFFGDRFSHIASGNGIIDVRTLQIIYFEVSVLIVMLPMLILILVGRII